MRIGAERFHYASRIHRELDVMLDGGVVLPAKASDRFGWLREQRLRWRLIPTKTQCMKDEDELMATVHTLVYRDVLDAKMPVKEFLKALPVQM